jgi:hypothetical protein
MTPKENRNENLPKLISGIFGKKFMGTHCNALLRIKKFNFRVKVPRKNYGIDVHGNWAGARY